MSAALITCASRHTNGTLPYYHCLCSGLQNPRFQRAKYYFCRRAAQLEEADSVEARAEIGKIVGIVLGVVALLLIIALIYRRFRKPLAKKLRECMTHCGFRQRFDECARMFCTCCLREPKHRLDEPAPNANLSGRPTSSCGSCCYSDRFLAVMEFFCDCDCFQGRRTPKYILPIIGKGKKPEGSSDVHDTDAEEAMMELHQPRRMRSVRRAPPPPMPAPPSFQPEERTGTGKRRAPPVPAAPVHYSHQMPEHYPHDKPVHYPQSEPGHYPQSEPEHYPQPEPAHYAHYQPRQPEYQPKQEQQAPPQYAEPHHTTPQHFTRAAPPRVSKEFTEQLNQAMMGRRVPSESDL